MGNTSSVAADYTARSAHRKATGTSFAYTSTMHSAAPADRKVHESVDPKRLNTFDKKVRECLDSPEHPLTIPVVVGFDQTGSMGGIPRILQEKLGLLKGATLKLGLVDAQLCFAAYGDAQNGEVAPLQVGQFESGIETEEWLNNLYLEGSGGGNDGETSGLLIHFMGNYSKLDSLDKRGKKGYLILVGDEKPLPKITKHEVEHYIGDPAQGDVTVEQAVEKCKESYEIFMFLIDNASARLQRSEQKWRLLIGDHNVIVTEGVDTIAEQVALLIARAEGVVDTLDDGMKVLLEEGADPDAVKRAGTAMVAIDARHDSVVAVKSEDGGTLPEAADPSGDMARL